MDYTILIADDDSDIRNLLKLYLENEQYTVLEAGDGEEAIRILKSKHVDLCILDIMMPKVNGYDVLRELRTRSNVPVIVVSAKNADSEKILGLNLGADDYMSKPFNPLEAVARVKSNIRRFYKLGAPGGLNGNQGIIKAGDLELDSDTFILKKRGLVIELTSIEYKIMELFMKHPGKVFTKQQIYENGWGDADVVSDNNIMVCISKLRAKLDDENTSYIKTIRGLGYRLEI